MTPDHEDERGFRLDEVVRRPGISFGYEYDFGDSWWHRIDVVEANDDAPASPVCVGGERACPPEDCGGVVGYDHMLRVLADPGHPQHEGLYEWAGEFDPERFNAEQVNNWLRSIAARTRKASA